MRDFTYSPSAYKELLCRVEELQSQFQKHELSLKRHCAAAFSDTLVAFLHLKAMRVFVESVLRFGVPANFAAFIVRPTSTKNLTKLRKVLGDLFRGTELFGQTYINTSAAAAADGDDGEAYYPYVNLPFTPLTPVAA